MKKKREVTVKDIPIQKVEKAVESMIADTTKKFLFKRTYIGLLGAFYQGKSYFLTEEQYQKLKGDLV